MKLRDIAQLMRASNLPTVWSNVTLGVFAGLNVVEPIIVAPSDQMVSVILTLSLAVSLLYCGGMVMNDYLDRRIDAVERPGRPIPSGRVSPGFAAMVFILMFSLGLFVAAAFILSTRSPDASISPPIVCFIVLLALIVSYNLLHRHALAIVLMGLCRAMVVIACSTVIAADQGLTTNAAIWIGGPAITLLFYTLAISIVARHEAQHERGPARIMLMIAAMPLLDSLWLLAMGFWPASIFCLACALLTKLAHRKVAGS